MHTESSYEIKQAVRRFLNDYQALIAHQKPYFPSRQKNIDSLIELGITVEEEWRILQNLCVEDYVSGPELDRDCAGDVWIFGVNIESIEIYIKIRITEYNSADDGRHVRYGKCLSFHKSERPLHYPLK